jgi:U3 small nucleolar RNA-associated protein 22
VLGKLPHLFSLCLIEKSSYQQKRNLILWSIAKFLSGKKFKKHVGKVEWRYFNGNQSVPALILTPPSFQSNEKKKQRTDNPAQTAKFTVQIVMAMESLSWIPAARMFPNRSNIKGGSATPYYNAILARDAFWRESPSIIMEDELGFPSFGDAFILAKVWCLQRGFLRGHDSFDEMQIATLILYLFRSRRAGSRMAPLQVFTILMKFLAEDWTTKVWTLPAKDQNEAQTVASCANAKAYADQAKFSPIDPNGDPVTLLLCHQQFSLSGAVLLNSSMLGNYLGTLSPAFCHSVSVQAKCTVECLNSSRSFSSLFMTTDRFWTCLDSYFHVPLKDIAWKRVFLRNSQAKDLGDVECLSRDLVQMLRQALGDRVTDVRLLTTGNGHDVRNGDPDQIPTHRVESPPTSSHFLTTAMGMQKVVVGLKINADTCHRAVDRGPPADDIGGVEMFLNLWGDAAELRRFKDGAIVHAVVWNTAKSDAEKQFAVFDGDERTQGGIVERIVQHVLGLHFLKEGRESPRFLLRDILSLVEGVRTPTSDEVSKLMTSTTAAHRSIINSFDSLASFLRKNSEQSGSDGSRNALGLPLQIDAVEPLSPSLRYSSTFPSIPHPMLGGDGKQAGKVTSVVSDAPIDVQIRFGRSSKWPTDLKAIGAAKTAMLAQLANGIESMKTRGSCPGFDGSIVVTPSHLTLGYQGYSWRILVRADPELYLLRGLQKPSDDAKRILSTLIKDHVSAASHHATIHAIHTLHPSAGHAVRLINVWLAAHMLSGLVPLEAVELLIAKVYSETESRNTAPATAVSGFFRVLRLIATHDWVRYV